MSDWTVVLSSDDAKQVVLYNQKDKQLAVKSTSSPLLSAIRLQDESDSVAVCSLCKRPFNSSSYIYKNYFRVLEEAYKANSPKPTSDRSRLKIPKTSINTGYYQQFFIELGRLGRGGGGSVFACEHVLNGTVLGRYAIKKVPVGDDIEWLTRLLHEVHILEAMRHENVVEYRHSWLEEYQPSQFAPKVPHLFILMEYAEEGSLEQALGSSHSFIGTESRVSLFLSISLGLSHLHSRGILHRDLKPSNILLKRDPKTNAIIPMISDFGESSAVTVGSSRVRTGATGTIEYMAPELLRTNKDGLFFCSHSASSDIWSLGMIFFECVYKKLPFTDLDDYNKVLEEITTMESVNIPIKNDIQPPLRSLLKAMLNVDPDARPSILSVIEILKAISPEDREIHGKLLPPSFTPVSLDRPASVARASKLSVVLGAASCNKYAFALIPALIGVTKYLKCYPMAVQWQSLLVDIIAIALCLYTKSLLASMIVGLFVSANFLVWNGKCCS